MCENGARGFEHNPLASFLFPGIILLLVLGVMPTTIAISLIR